MIQAVGVLLALVVLAGLPCFIAFIIMIGDPVADRTGRAVARLRVRPVTAPVEDSTARLRDLSQQLRQTPETEVYLRAALIDAYDQALRDACLAVRVGHRLDELTGFDLDIERLRLAEKLTEAGLIVERVDHDCRGRP